jgi:3-hydroxymyristoyl/3-hydroxydecanoyl-(acyl carrier protein) dehydratase
VNSLPRDAQGKLSAEALRAVFESNGRDAIPLGETRGSHSIERRLEVPPDLSYLDGHFDEFPIVAGVVMLRWVMLAAEAIHGSAPRIRSIEALKFPTPLLPGQRFTLLVETRAEKDRLDFRIYDDERIFATGRCKLMASGNEPS